MNPIASNRRDVQQGVSFEGRNSCSFFFSQLELEVSKVDRELQVEYFLMVGRQPDFDALQQPSTSSTPKRLVSVEKVCTSSG